jgi:DHA2 family multidrug resistance protein
MTSTAEASPRGEERGRTLLVAGVVLASLAEAIAGTVLSLGRNDIIGDTYATPDEVAWLDVGYTAFKVIGFAVTPWLIARFNLHRLVVASTAIMGLTSALAVFTANLGHLVALRVIQGFAGGVLLVAAQTLLFLAYPPRQQPMVQAVFAIGAVVAPATVAPALQGWLIDSQSWSWIFFSAVPASVGAVGLMLIAGDHASVPAAAKRFDGPGFVLLSATLVCLTYVLSQGSRWDWFEEPKIVWLTIIAAAAFLAFVAREVLVPARRTLDWSVFRDDGFAFAFFVSFVAGAALYGSAYLVLLFPASVLAFTPTQAGSLLLPSSGLFIGSLLLAGFLMQRYGLPPIATVPFGVLSIMVAMWMLSGSTSESGRNDLMQAVMLRGLGLGFLFLSITLIAFSGLATRALASGIGLFNVGRQVGGLAGVAALQTLIDHQVASNPAILAAHMTAGGPAIAERLSVLTALLVGRGMDAASAGRAATVLLARAVTGQSTVIAFDTAFNAVALLFVVAAPILIATKIGLSSVRRAHR